MTAQYQWDLGFDGGASKTLARLKCRNGGTSLDLKSGPSSLSIDPDKAISTVLEMASKLVDQADVPPEQVSFAGGFAGTSNQAEVEKLYKCLEEMGFIDPNIVSDADTSFQGASGGKACIVIAVGTGSIASTLTPDGRFFTTDGWGFKVGDLASGAAIGRMAVQEVMLELEQYEKAGTPLCLAVTGVTGRSKEETQSWINQASATDFASLAPLVIDLYHKQDTAAGRIMQQSKTDLETLIERADRGSNLPITLVGGLAPTYRGLLSENYVSRLFEAEGSSLDGACQIANQRV